MNIDISELVKLLLNQEKERKSLDLETTRLLLGHTTYETTKKYLHLVDNEIQNKSLKFNPINSLHLRTTDNS